MRVDFLRGETLAVGAAVLKTRPLWGWIARLDPDPEGQREITDILGRGSPPQIVAVGEDVGSFFGDQMNAHDCVEILQMLFEQDEARIRDVAKSLRENPMIDGEWGFTRFAWITLWLH